MQIAIDRPASSERGSAPPGAASPSVSTATAVLSNAPPLHPPGRAGSEARPLPPGAKMAAGAVELRRLQWRLEELERRVGLGGGGCGPRKVPGEELRRTAGGGLVPSGGVWGAAAGQGPTAPSPPCVPLQVADELVKVQVALSNIAGKRERIKILFKKSERVLRKGTDSGGQEGEALNRFAALNKITFPTPVYFGPLFQFIWHRNK